MNYSEVFSKAWKIVWKFKALWIFGIFSSCARLNSGGGGGSSGGGGGSSHLINSGGVFAFPNVVLPKQVFQWYLQFQNAWDTEPWGVFLILLAVFFVVMALVVLSLFLGVLGRVGVARGAWLADDGEEKLNFSRIYNESKPYFWRVFLFFLLLFAASIAIGGLVAIPLLLVIVFTLGFGLLFLIPLLIVVSFAVKILIEQTIVAIVGEDLGVFAAIERAWKLLVEKPWPQVVVGLATSIGEMAVMFVLIIPIFLISIFFQTDAVIGVGAIISGAGFVLYLPVMILASGILYTYIGSVWALTFKRLTQPLVPAVVEVVAE
ncbi:MAG: hypothetical protein CVU41_10045 [Chloroflexi bacterium HGW-Chloroflexi-3]|nr:MAG: hypothetical protein CVU41_10045 [Chloroflexi bacterium HGW-Chloroflexi-3]